MQISFQEYLNSKGHTMSSIRSYTYACNLFKRETGNSDTFSFKDVITYLSILPNQKLGLSRKLFLLYGMKKYFDYLIETGARTNHPCRNLFVRKIKKRSIIHQDLFTSGELELLMTREERYKDLKLKNQALISLLIYQGLYSFEIAALNINHVNTDSRVITIKSSKRTSRRRILLTKTQADLINEYIQKDRLKLTDKNETALIVGKTGNRINVDDIHYLVSTFKGMFPDRKLTPVTIRQSVIANWLNEKQIPMEEVQLMAGQKWISSTQRYRQLDLDEQCRKINKWFPI